MHRGYTAERYLERLAAARARRRRPGRHHRHHRRLPRRDRRRLRAHARGRRRGRVRLRLHVHLLAPTRHRGGDDGRSASSTRRSCAERFERLRVVVERARSPATGPGSAGSRRCSSRARARRTPRCSPVAPASTSSCTSGRRGRCAAGAYAEVEITGAAPAPPASGGFVEVIAGPRHKRASPRSSAGSTAGLVARRADRPVTATGRVGPDARRASVRDVGDGTLARAVAGTSRSSPSTRCRSTGAWTSARPSRRRPSGPRCRHHGLDLVDPAEDFTVTDFQEAADDGAGRPSPAADGRRAAGGRHRAVPAGGRRRARPARAGGRTSRAELDGTSSTPSALHEPSAPSSTRSRRVADGADQPAPGRAGAGGDASAAAGRSARSARALDRLPADARRAARACAGPAPMLAERIEQRFAAMLDGRPARRGRAPGRRARRTVPDGAPGPRLQGAARRTSTGECSLAEATELAVDRAPASSPCARSGGSGATPAYAGSRCPTTVLPPSPVLVRALR